MKKLLMMLPILAIAGIANAQTEGFSKGSLFATGSIGFGSEKEGDFKQSQFTFNPKVGYFVTPNVAVGLNLGVTSWTTDYGVGDDDKASQFNVGAFGRYYFTPANKFSMFLNLGFDFVNYKEDDVPEDYKETGFNIGFAPGFNYFITNRLALETSIGILGFSSMKPDVDGAESTTNFNFGVGLSDINFGLVYKFK